MRVCGLAIALLIALPNASEAVDINQSRLSTVDLAKCRQIKRHRDGGAWICKGLPGYPVYFAEGDLRQMMGFGPAPQRRRSATQTLGAFNSIFERNRRATIEWRVEKDARGRAVPYATIVRYHTSRDGENSDVLVITKVDARDSCQLATIDARANADAMVMARTWATAEARKRACQDAPVVLGVPGKGPK